MTSEITPRTLNQFDAAAYLGENQRTLRDWRLKNTGPVYYRTADQHNAPVRYRVADLDAWMDERIAATVGGVS